MGAPMSGIDVEIGARLRARRLELGLSLVHVAKMLNPPVAAQQISKFELGTNRLAAPQIVALCAGLSISPGELLGVEPAQPRAEDAQAVWLGQIIASLPTPEREAVAQLVRVMREPARLAG